jgi:hypothetical protein
VVQELPCLFDRQTLAKVSNRRWVQLGRDLRKPGVVVLDEHFAEVG